MPALWKSVDSLPALAAFQTNGKLKISPQKTTTIEKKSRNDDTLGPVKLIWVTRVISVSIVTKVIREKRVTSVTSVIVIWVTRLTGVTREIRVIRVTG